MKYLIILLFIIMPVISSAYTEIINNVTNSISTGGSSKSSVKVYAEINGKIVEDFEKNLENGEKIEYQSTKILNDEKIETSTQIPTDSLVYISSTTPQVSAVNVMEKIKQIWKYVFGLFKIK